MATRLLIGLSAAALITAALAPAAFAQDLAEGVSCSDHSCRNDTDDIYRVQIRVQCSGFGGTYETPVWVNSHTTQEVQVGCNGRTVPGATHPGSPTMGPDGKWDYNTPMVTDPPTYEPSYVTGIDYLSAAVDNSSRRLAG
ncbi:hypothetical protein GPX89_10925 [Nocardia sp. ET3-3]|uniref:Uncharacterized protein n=1 Tax=Nocardia terrae TaxID=2675851 RepID=A0A7K1UTS1_9NOCA|nr:hypothetical protein [Nocardia terrae]MVU77753.1 hypothetical protein [Nocardia terrae]